MRWVLRLRALWMSVARRRALDDALQRDLDFHLDQEIAERVREGHPPAEARRLARIALGSPERVREEHRDLRRVPVIETAWQDVRYAARSMRRHPGFSAVAILSLAIGIGANAAIFSIVNRVLLQPLAYADPQDIYVAQELTSIGVSPVNPVHARAWAAGCPSLTDVSVLRSGRVRVSTGGEPASVRSVAVSSNLFTLFRVEPIAGRTFRRDEDRAAAGRIVVLSESLWRSRFHADPAIIGRSILIDDEPSEVIGIVPGSFRVPYVRGADVRFEVFQPLILAEAELARVNGNYNYAAVVRVAPGTGATQALAEIDAVQATFRRSAGLSVGLRGVLTPVHEFVTDEARPGLLMLAAAVGAVLLIVCVNLANLLLARIVSRSRETAIRTALGASRGRLFAQALVESLILSTAGGLLALVAAAAALGALVGTAGLDIPRIQEVRVDAAVVAFGLGLAVIAGLLFGVLPAWRGARRDPQEALRAGSHTVTDGRGGLRLRKALISLEVGLSAALLIVAVLLTSSLSRLLNVDKGFEVDRILTLDVELSGNRYAEAVRRGQMFDRVLANVGAIPGVVAAGAITQLPALGQTWNDPIYLENAPRDQWHAVDNRYASPGYFRTMKIGVRSGRFFEERDRGHAVAVLSEKAARLLWPGDLDPVGRTFMGEDDKLKTLVGVVSEVRATLHEQAPPTAYYPYWQREPFEMSLVVRTAGDPSAVGGFVRAALRDQDSLLAIPPVQAMQDLVDRSVAERRFLRSVMLTFAASAFLVAALGIYGIVSYSVARRRNEIGIRMALGAGRPRLFALVLREGMTPVVIGLAAGAAAAPVLGQGIRALLFDVRPGDPATIAGVVLAMIAVAVLACVVPARRVTGPNAVAALRSE